LNSRGYCFSTESDFSQKETCLGKIDEYSF